MSLFEAARDAVAGLDDLEEAGAAVCQTLKLDGYPRSQAGYGITLDEIEQIAT